MTTLHRLFERQAAATPETTALAFAEGEISYEDANAGANRLARRLRAAGVERLAGAGADVTLDVSPNLARAWDGTSRSVMPAATSAAVADWLDAAVACPEKGPSAPIAISRPGSRTVDGEGWRERPLVLDTDGGRLLGVLCEPVAATPRDDWVVFLNAGRVRRIGPNRMAVEYARAWAAEGLASLRLDLPGIGDSDGALVDDELLAVPNARWYARPVFRAAAGAALDRLTADHGARRFALTGLCSGASWALEVAEHDDRVAAVTLLNPRVLFVDRRAAPLDAWAEARRIARNPRTWDAWRGRGLRSLPLGAVRGAALTLIGRGDVSWQRDIILESVAKHRSRGTRIGIVFSDGDPGIGYFERHLGPGWLAELERCGASVDVVRGPDHTFRPPWSRVVVKRIIESRLTEIGFLVDGEVGTAVA